MKLQKQGILKTDFWNSKGYRHTEIADFQKFQDSRNNYFYEFYNYAYTHAYIQIYLPTNIQTWKYDSITEII